MDFFKEFSKQVSSVARTVTEKSKEGAENSRLNGEVRAAQEALDQLYRRYGELCYGLTQGRGDPVDREALETRIRAARLELEEAVANRDAAKEIKRCQGCGTVLPGQARYCFVCGKKLPEEAPKPEPVAVGEYCPACGAAREGGEAVCPVCGAAFDGAPRPEPEPAPTPAQPAHDVEEPEDALE